MTHHAALLQPRPAPDCPLFDLAAYFGPFKYLKRGGYWLFEAPQHSKWEWRGMAESLAMINRYDGATHFPYSVAQHSCIGHDMAPPEVRLHFLLHDMPEVIIGDKTRPVKDNEASRAALIRSRSLSALRYSAVPEDLCALTKTAMLQIEDLHKSEDGRVMEAIYQKANIPLPTSEEHKQVKLVDMRMLKTETRDLLEEPPHSLPLRLPKSIEPYPCVIKPWTWDRAADEFLKRLSNYVKV
nr:hypothetical protein [uncultured Cohaesibacter sp.]